jgi:serine/threonine protein kinase
MESSNASHERALYALEATVKYCAAAAASAWMMTRGNHPADEKAAKADAAAQDACAKLVRPSLGHWTGILRCCVESLPADHAIARWLARARGTEVTHEVPILGGKTVGEVLEHLPTYRNEVAGHGAGLSSGAAEQRVAAVVALIRQILTALVNDQAPLLTGRAGGRAVRLVGPTASVDLEHHLAQSENLLLRCDGLLVPLSPLWIFDPEDDDVLVVNKGMGTSKVEYLSYGSPRSGSGLVALRGATADHAAKFLEIVCGHGKLNPADLERLVEENEVQELVSRATGDRYGPYRVVRKVAVGGQGILYEAVEESPPRRVALKTLSLEGTLSDAARRRMKEEAAALAQVEHPHVVPFYSAGETDGVPWIAMKFVDGKSLAQVIQSLREHAGTISLAEWNAAASSQGDRLETEIRKTHAERVAELGRDAALALAACHARGVIHRDVKPGNLMLDEHGRVMLADFGLARISDSRSRTFTRQLLGTLQYLAPEALLPADRKGPDARVDVYGLGATLYEVLALRTPFAEYAGDDGALLHAVQAKDPPLLRRIAPAVPRDLETIVMKALDKDRDRRYQSAQELADDLERFLRGEPIKARPAGPLTKARKWAGRHPGKSVGALAATLLACGLGLWAWQQWALLSHERANRQQDISFYYGSALTTLGTQPLAEEVAALNIDRLDFAAIGAEMPGTSPSSDESDDGKQLNAELLAAADRPLRVVVEKLRGQAQSQAQLDVLVAKQQRIHRLAEFYRTSDAAWFAIGDERDEDAMKFCSGSLVQLGILDASHRFIAGKPWWQRDRLPVADLTETQFAEVQQEAYRQLLLLGMLRMRPGIKDNGAKALTASYAQQFAQEGVNKAKAGVQSLFKGLVDKPRTADLPKADAPKDAEPTPVLVIPTPEAAVAFRSALEALAKARELESAGRASPSMTVPLLERACRDMLSRVDPSQPPVPKSTAAHPTVDEMQNPADLFLIGTAHFFLGKMPGDPLTQGMKLFWQGQGIDFDTPLETAERLLREVARRDPQRYWHHFNLGWTLMALGDPRRDEARRLRKSSSPPTQARAEAAAQTALTHYRQAELAFTTCVALQPDNARGYEQRGLVLVRQAVSLPADSSRRAELTVRAMIDLDFARDHDPSDPSTWWPRADSLNMLDRTAESLAAYSRAFELEQDLLARPSRRGGLELGRALAREQIQKANDPALTAAAWTVLAQCDLTLGTASSFAAAEKSATQAIALDPTQARAYAVRGQVRLLQGQSEKALKDFEQALKLNANNFLAAAGRVRAYVKLNQSDKALAALKESLPHVVDVRWQRSEMYLLEYALCKHQGQDALADTARQEARKLDESLTEDGVQRFVTRFP